MILSKSPIEYIQFEAGAWKNKPADIIVETPVSLTVNGEIWLTFMCTPTDLEAMAVGFLFNEGLIHSIEEVVDVRVCAAGDNVDVWLTSSIEKPDKWRRTSGCTGGITSVDFDTHSDLKTPPNGILLSPDQIGKLIEMLFDSQDLYRSSGGVHTSALSNGQSIVLVSEDIGRHNTLDKIAGLRLMKHVEVNPSILLTTGRISSEMLQKASRLGASLLISRTSPSSLSIRLADQRGITLIGYARRTSFRVYTHPERLLLPGSTEIVSSQISAEKEE